MVGTFLTAYAHCTCRRFPLVSLPELVGWEGFEPSRPCGHKALNLAWLPVTPPAVKLVEGEERHSSSSWIIFQVPLSHQHSALRLAAFRLPLGKTNSSIVKNQWVCVGLTLASFNFNVLALGALIQCLTTPTFKISTSAEPVLVLHDRPTFRTLFVISHNLVAKVGLEPTPPYNRASLLRRVRLPFRHSAKLERSLGLNAHQIWSGRQDLNLRPRVPKTRALPDCATPR